MVGSFSRIFIQTTNVTIGGLDEMQDTTLVSEKDPEGGGGGGGRGVRVYILFSSLIK